MKVNRTYLSKWAYPIIASGVVGWCVGSGTVASLCALAPQDINLLSFYNILIVVKAWFVASTLGFIGAFTMALAKSPLDLHQLVITDSEQMNVKVEGGSEKEPEADGSKTGVEAIKTVVLDLPVVPPHDPGK